MRPVSPSRMLLAGVLVGAAMLVAAPTPASALEVGEMAPEVEVNDTYHCDGFSIQEHRGRLILFELFSTG